ncbi:MAG: DUF2127 domain-containing protein [Proteobacteria bacterium]|nr:DUF2127 domain-containing protein [Pseudomonadota bacterium]MBS0574091.1 DUF2127 domain-containing protein [Pseudomonadota bacterium]
MTPVYKTLPARILHWLFEASLAIKGILCAIETLSGLGLLLTPNPLVARMVYWATHLHLAADPYDTMADLTRQAVDFFPLHIQSFYGWYLLAHGGLKLAMVVMLWLRILWAYPAAMLVLVGFVLYQLTEFVHAGSPVLLLLAFFDFFMVGLVWQEYRVLRTARAAELT